MQLDVVFFWSNQATSVGCGPENATSVSVKFKILQRNGQCNLLFLLVGPFLRTIADFSIICFHNNGKYYVAGYTR